MDVVLIIIMLAIVIAIGFILSRPFLNADLLHQSYNGAKKLKFQYQALLTEIKSLESELTLAQNAEDVADLLTQKKQLATNILRQMDLENNFKDDVPDDGKPNQALPEREINWNEVTFCSQCGEQVKYSDKFCTYCGHRLQP